jgi:hypothetical protein
MIRPEVNWRLALYLAGLIGGSVWAVLAGMAFKQQGYSATAFEITAGGWWLAVGTSASVLAFGIVAFYLARSITVRSVGIALMVSALSGWFAVGCIAVWGL